jgi:hypothetical protein
MVGVVAMLLSFQVRAAEPGEASGEIGGADSEKPKQTYSLQASDPDAPKDPAVLAAQKKAAAEAELAKKSKPKDEGPPIYQKWQFWAIVGGVVVGLVGAAYATSKLVHSINGGDVAPCPMGYLRCYGEGR